MSIRDDLTTALKESQKSKDLIAMSTIRLINAAIKDRDINARSSGNMDGIADTEIMSLMQSMIKQRQESSQTYADAGRDDLADRELDEIKVIERFMPAQMGEAETTAAIESVISDIGAADIKDMGKVMNELKTRYAGQMDMAKVGGAVKAKLAG